jgi:hypothetical protein
VGSRLYLGRHDPYLGHGGKGPAPIGLGEREIVATGPRDRLRIEFACGAAPFEAGNLLVPAAADVGIEAAGDTGLGAGQLLLAAKRKPSRPRRRSVSS